jgi:hypothetical protein
MLSLHGNENISSLFPKLFVHPLICLTDNQLAIFGEIVLGDLEVKGGRSLPYSAGDIVVRTVAGAEPATIVTGLADGDTTKMGADT